MPGTLFYLGNRGSERVTSCRSYQSPALGHIIRTNASQEQSGDQKAMFVSLFLTLTSLTSGILLLAAPAYKTS